MKLASITVDDESQPATPFKHRSSPETVSQAETGFQEQKHGEIKLFTTKNQNITMTYLYINCRQL